MTSKKADPSSSDKTPEVKNRGWPKGKRRYPKGVGAPKQPLSGYVHFLNERREAVRASNPDITFSDLSKKLASEWSSLPEAEKIQYNELAKRDKDRYDKEFADYQNTDNYKNYLESQSQKEKEQVSSAPVNSESSSSRPKKKKKVNSSSSAREKRNSFEESDGEQVVVAEPAARENSNSFDIPIFTEEFLDHNRARELELRQLRKQTTEFEEQNAVLGKHIESMKCAISKLEVETVQQRQSNAGLQQQLDLLRQMVVTSFRGVSLPGNASQEPLTHTNVDQYVAKLLSMTEREPELHEGLITTVRDIVGKMDFTKIQG